MQPSTKSNPVRLPVSRPKSVKGATPKTVLPKKKTYKPVSANTFKASQKKKLKQTIAASLKKAVKATKQREE